MNYTYYYVMLLANHWPRARSAMPVWRPPTNKMPSFSVLATVRMDTST